MTKIIPASPADAGCWISGHMGQYAVAEMIVLAGDHGYSDLGVVELAERKLATMGASTAPELSMDDEGALMWAADEVEVWLNENVAPAGYFFEWVDGEFFLTSAEEAEEEGDEDSGGSNPYAGPGGLLDEIRQAERLLGTE